MLTPTKLPGWWLHPGGMEKEKGEDGASYSTTRSAPNLAHHPIIALGSVLLITLRARLITLILPPAAGGRSCSRVTVRGARV